MLVSYFAVEYTAERRAAGLAPFRPSCSAADSSSDSTPAACGEAMEVPLNIE